MTDCEWIVCERTGRWAAALRVALDRQTPPPTSQPYLREVRTFDELSRQLTGRQQTLAMVEVRPSNLANALAWMAEAGCRYPRARLVALLECDDLDIGMRHKVQDAVRAAGVVAVAQSPRRLQHVLAIGQRHAATRSDGSNRPEASQSIGEWARALLPWQRA